MPAEPVILPPTYYLDNFNYLIDFVKKKSGHLLNEQDQGFIDDFDNLSKDGKCLFIRLINRKGPYFRSDKLDYEEIQDIPAALQELDINTFISPATEKDPSILSLFRKDELLVLFPDISYARNFKKDDLILEIDSEVNDWNHVLFSKEQIILPEKREELEYIKLLFFGHHKGMMSDFVVRDIGNVTLEKLDESRFKPWFDSIDEAKSVYNAFKLKDLARLCLKILSAEEIDSIFRNVDWKRITSFTKAQKVCDKYLLEIGKKMEQELFPDRALTYYQYTESYPSRERQVRILEGKNLKEQAISIANKMLEKPKNAKEAIFAKDFLAKSQSRVRRSTTIAISNAIELLLDPPPSGISIENYVLKYYYDQGYSGIHSENYIWRSAFGLIFWDLMYDQEHLNFHNPLQRQASNLYEIEDLTPFEKKLKKFRSKKGLKKHIKNVIEQKESVANPLVYWNPNLYLHLEKWVDFLNLDASKKMLLQMAANLKEYATGFPDLFIWNDKEYFFYEVKSPNDHLAPHQLFWIEQMKSNNINVDILRIRFK